LGSVVDSIYSTRAFVYKYFVAIKYRDEFVFLLF